MKLRHFPILAPLAIAVCLAFVVGMGAWPKPFLESAADAAHSLLGNP